MTSALRILVSPIQGFVEAAKGLVARDGFANASTLIRERPRALGQDPDIFEAELT